MNNRHQSIAMSARTHTRAFATTTYWRFVATGVALLSLASSSAHAASGGGEPTKIDLIQEVINFKFFILFLIVFLIAAFILNKFAWGPILAGLDQREATIQASLDNADKIESEMAGLEATVQAKIDDADEQSKQIVAEARKGAGDAARHIEKEAKDEARIVMENARRELASEQAKAQASLKAESADIAIALATKILGENLDNDKSRRLTDRIIDQI